jgi:hypothetical protein
MRLPNEDPYREPAILNVCGMRIRIDNELVHWSCHCCLLSFSRMAGCDNVGLGKFFENIFTVRNKNSLGCHIWRFHKRGRDPKGIFMASLS